MDREKSTLKCKVFINDEQSIADSNKREEAMENHDHRHTEKNISQRNK